MILLFWSDIVSPKHCTKFEQRDQWTQTLHRFDKSCRQTLERNGFRQGDQGEFQSQVRVIIGHGTTAQLFKLRRRPNDRNGGRSRHWRRGHRKTVSPNRRRAPRPIPRPSEQSDAARKGVDLGPEADSRVSGPLQTIAGPSPMTAFWRNKLLGCGQLPNSFWVWKTTALSSKGREHWRAQS